MGSEAKGLEDHDAAELLQAQSRVWSQMFGFIGSASLKCAIQLGIADAILRHGRPITVPELARDLRVAPEKSHGLFRLMRILAHSGFFETVPSSEGQGEQAYDLNLTSKLLLRDNPFSVSPFVMMILDPVIVKPCDYLSAWLVNDKATPFATAFGMEFWENTGCNPAWNELFNQGMASDARLVSRVLVDGAGREVFKGICSLVDVGGGTGTLAKAIVETFPQIECTVLDLPHVVGGLEGCKNLRFVQGDMFEKVPTADAAILKWILHDWGDDDCIKILKRCKDAISPARKGGKVIIIDVVVRKAEEADQKSIESQLCFDMMMMGLVPGKERTEEEWSKLFIDAGFNGYKITTLDLGLRSLIEVYP